MKDAIDLLNQRIAELEAENERQAKTYEQFQEACYELDRYKDAWKRGNELIEVMEEVKNKQLARIAELEAENERLKGMPTISEAVRAVKLEAENDRLRDGLAELTDRFNNGVQYDPVENYYILVWTERELKVAKRKAEKLRKELGWDKPDAAMEGET